MSYIALPEPRRSWLMHCDSAFGELAVCEIAVDDGAVSIVPPAGQLFELQGSAIAQFRAAFDEAIAVAEEDLRDSANGRVGSS